MPRIRQTIARRLVQSIGPVPHFFLTAEIDMERAAEARAQLNALGEDPKISFNDIVLKVVANATQAGTHRFRATVTSSDKEAQHIAEETTRYFQTLTGSPQGETAPIDAGIPSEPAPAFETRRPDIGTPLQAPR